MQSLRIIINLYIMSTDLVRGGPDEELYDKEPCDKYHRIFYQGKQHQPTIRTLAMPEKELLPAQQNHFNQNRSLH